MPPFTDLPPGARVFEERAAEYDSWFDDSLPFSIELSALQTLQGMTNSPAMEIGVGPGRFAAALHTEFGVDPALSALQLASRRDIMCVNALGDTLPVRSGTMATVWLLFTLCFLENPAKVLKECLRILRQDGCLVIGFIPRSSAWGEWLEQKGQAGHPYYRHATLYSSEAVLTLLEASGFTVTTALSTLLQKPDNVTHHEPTLPGIIPGAGFCIFVARKKE